MMTDFGARLLGRMGSGHLSEIKFSNENCAGPRTSCASAGSAYVEELAKLLGHTGDRAVTKTRTPEAKATGSGARDALELSGTFQATVYRTALGMFGHNVLDRPDCQFAAKAVMNMTREPRMLD